MSGASLVGTSALALAVATVAAKQVHSELEPQIAVGLPGPMGPPGLRGEMGPSGLPGDTGVEGPVGPTGPIGEQGERGENGRTLVDRGNFVAGDYTTFDVVYDLDRSNKLFMFKSSQTCDGTEILTDATFVLPYEGGLGPEGPRGLQGERGAAGETGATGPEGQQGSTGPTGPQGPVGTQGPTGATGEAGDTGSAGLKGDQGDEGPPGQPGPTGVGLRVGSVSMFAGLNPPAGTLVCNGDAVSRSTYALLFTQIGVSYGAGDSVNTFNLPDFSDSSPVGHGGQTTIGKESTKSIVVPSTGGIRHAHTGSYQTKDQWGRWNSESNSRITINDSSPAPSTQSVEVSAGIGIMFVIETGL